jgi:hypothetical protein
MAAEQAGVTLTDRGAIVDALWHAVDDAAGNLANVPGLVRRVLETEAWRKRSHRGRVFEHERFLDFVTAKPLAGCGWPPEKVEALIKDEPATLAMWREAVTPQNVNQHTVPHDNVIRHQQGNSKAYTLDRLKREAPGLFQAVCAGKLSANAAAIEAGFRKKPTPFEQVQNLIPKLTAAEKRKLRELLA